MMRRTREVREENPWDEKRETRVDKCARYSRISDFLISTMRHEIREKTAVESSRLLAATFQYSLSIRLTGFTHVNPGSTANA